MRALLPAICLLLACSGCASLGRLLPWGRSGVPEELAPERVPEAIERAEACLERGDTHEALEWTRAASKAKGLPTEQRNEVQALLEQAAARRIEELSGADADPEELVELYELELPRQLAVSAAVEAARQMVARGKLVKAYRLLQKVDKRYPLHHERYAAASLLVEIGLVLADDRSRFLWFYTRRDDGIAVLEYLVLNAPWEPRCDEAYAKLAAIYEEDGDWKLAIERHENLILYHPESRYRSYSQARVPHLRLFGIESPEYDRNELVQARRELEAWLERYAGSEPGEGLEHGVRIDLTDCLRRLADSDLGIARFYERVDNPYGAAYHAGRAREEARVAADEERQAEAAAILARVAAADGEEEPAAAAAEAQP